MVRLSALAAVQADRPAAIRELTLNDIDMPSRRITVSGHRQRLGELPGAPVGAPGQERAVATRS